MASLTKAVGELSSGSCLWPVLYNQRTRKQPSAMETMTADAGWSSGTFWWFLSATEGHGSTGVQ